MIKKIIAKIKLNSSKIKTMGIFKTEFTGKKNSVQEEK